MKFKKLLIPAILSLSLFTLSSCDIIGFIKDNSNIDTSGLDELINGQEETYTPVEIDETNEDYGYLDLQTYESKKTDYISFYTLINDYCKNFMTSNTNLSATSRDIGGGVSKNYYIIEDSISYTAYNLTYDEASSIYKTVVLDHPEYYFLDNTLLSATMQIGSITRGYISLVCDPDYKDASTRSNFNTQISAYDQTIKDLFTTTDTVTDKIKKIHDYIINTSEYAFKADGHTPDDSSYAHNLLGVMVNHKGVCESYSEAFQYLLKQNNIYCILVTGTGITSEGSEAHAWNYVKLNYDVDGEVVPKWFGFDLTWDDPVSSHPVLSHEYYGRNNSMLTDHIPAPEGDFTYGLEYMYTLPTLSDTHLPY